MTEPPIGALRHRLQLQSLQRTADGGGGVTESWQTETTLWGRIQPRSGREPFLGHQWDSRISHVIWVRHGASVTPDKRFRLKERVFHILAVMDWEERRRWLRCLCEERHL